MDIRVHPSHISGTVAAPPSKSLTQRAIAAGLLSSGTTVIRHPSFCNDSLAAMQMAEALGAHVTSNADSITVQAGLRPVYPVSLHCGESGLALRMFAPIASLLNPIVTITGEGSLAGRPVDMIADALSQLGVTVVTNAGYLPMKLMGELAGRHAVIDGSSGSQLLTGLLMALPVMNSDSEITVENLKSKPYISLTLQLLSDFGISIENNDFRHFLIKGNQSYKAHEYTVEGDWSGAAFLLVAGAIAGEVTISNLNCDSMQADIAVLKALKTTGADLTEHGRQVSAVRSDLKAFTFDATDSPDLFPPLAALASYCSGTSRIKGVSRLAHKESDRAGAIAEVLGKMNISARIEDDDMLIEGGEVRGAVVSSHNDHRIAMMSAVMALGSRGEVTVTGAQAVDKSFPDFFDVLAGLGATVLFTDAKLRKDLT
jgi:3-phosphoshikimate 1-carboxyvinyltransferase